MKWFKLSQLKNAWFEKLMIGWLICWWLVIWLWGASEWRLVILLGGGSLLWPLGWFWDQIHRVPNELELPIFQPATWSQLPLRNWWLVWFLSLTLSTVLSQIPGVSFGGWQWWLASWLWLWWLMSFRSPELRQHLVTQTVIWGVTILAGLSWFLAWWKTLGLSRLLLFPEPNYITAAFGHHHLAALIILAWPLFWQKYGNNFQAQTKRWGHRWWGLIWLVFMTVTLGLSFSRSANLAVIIQLIFWLVLNQMAGLKQAVGFKLWGRQFYFWIIAGVVVVGLMAASFGFKTLVRQVNQRSLPGELKPLCYQWWAPAGSCFPVPEARWTYWSQVMEVWQAFPVTGSGLETFGLVAKRWLEAPFLQSQLAHSFLGQVLAEQGAVGLGLWLIGLGFWGQKLWRRWRQNPGETAWLISVAGAVIVGAVDFDWQLAGYWWPLLAIITVGLIPVDASTIVVEAKQKFWERFFWGSLISLQLFLAIMSGVTGYFLLSNSTLNRSTEKWLNFWPVAGEWQKKLIQKKPAKNFLQTYTLKHYSHHPEFITANLAGLKTAPASEKWFWLERLWPIDPWQYWSWQPFEVAQTLPTQNLTARLQVLDHLETWWLPTRLKFWQLDQQRSLAKQLYLLGDELLSLQNWGQAGTALRLAQEFEPWILHDHQVNLITTDLETSESTWPVNQTPAVLAVFADLNQELYGANLMVNRGRFIFWLERYLTWLNVNTDLSFNFQPPVNIKRYLFLSPLTSEILKVANQTLVLIPDEITRPQNLNQALLTALDSAPVLAKGYDPVNRRSWWLVPQKYLPLSSTQPNSYSFMRFSLYRFQTSLWLGPVSQSESPDE